MFHRMVKHIDGGLFPLLFLLCWTLLAFTHPCHAVALETVVTITSRYNTQTRQPLILRQFFARHPGLRLEQWDGSRMPEEGARASLAKVYLFDCRWATRDSRSQGWC